MGRPAVINRPMSKLIKKKQSGCSSMKKKKRRAKIAKKRKVLWRKYILPNIDIDDLPAHPPSNKRKPLTKRPLTGKQQRKLRKKMKRLTKPDEEDRMEGLKTSKVVEVSQKPEDAEEKAEDTSQKVKDIPKKVDEKVDDDGQWEDVGGWEDVEMKEDA